MNRHSLSLSAVLVQSCVTPRKVQRVHEALQCEQDWYKCAIKLLPELFTLDKLAMSNMEGNFVKQPLDKTKLHTLKGNYSLRSR